MDEHPDGSNKRQNNEDASDKSSKKPKLFSSKEFRSQLNSNKNSKVLQNFLHLIKNENGQDYILKYLENGGNCLELLQALHERSDASLVVIYEILHAILLQISAKYPQYHNSAHEACRYLLNNHITFINKMIGLSSSAKERLVILKLLTSIVSFSALLAKDVLLHVNFHQTNLELLTKVNGKNEVRNAFIHFLTAFLVDGQYPTLAVLLEKRGLITSIVSGLKFDKANTVCLVLTAMKNHILENPQVSKTAKMKTFSTPIVKDIVNLYNWKGPGGYGSTKKGQRTVFVDEFEKSKVSEAVHDFLLVLCSSHKFGVIFRDQTLGLGKKNQNSLMYTVLASLERPWEHSYAGELVIKICGACPDLMKTMWINLRPFLEPRPTAKWLHAIKFIEQLLDQLQPSCIEFCVKELDVYQLFQIISFIIMPVPILKIIITENGLYEKHAVKYYVLKILMKLLKSVQTYFIATREWLTLQNHQKLLNYLTGHISKHFPNAKYILTKWDTIDEILDENFSHSVIDYLNVTFDLFECYKQFAPQLLDELNRFNIDFKDFMKKTERFCDDKLILQSLQIKMIQFFLTFEQSFFSLKSNEYRLAISLSFRFYYETRNLTAFDVVKGLINNTNVFEGSENQINYWINGILNLKHYDNEVAIFIVKLLEVTLNSDKTFIENVFNYCNENVSTSLKYYLEFVILNLFHNGVDCNYQCNNTMLSKNLITYITKWQNGSIGILTKMKGKIDVFTKFSVAFFESGFDIFIKENPDIFNCYFDVKLDLLQTSIFYLVNLIEFNDTNELYLKNCETFVNYLIENDFVNENLIKTIFYNRVLANNLSLFELNNASYFVINVIKKLRDSIPEKYLELHRSKIYKDILKIIKKPHKFEGCSFNEISDVIHLSYEQSYQIIQSIFELNQFDTIFLKLILVSLKRLVEFPKENAHLQPLQEESVRKLSDYISFLINIKNNDAPSVAAVFHDYLKIYPQLINCINVDLVNSLMNFGDYNKDVVILCGYLIELNPEFLNCFQRNLEKICEKKGVLLHLLEVAITTKCNDDVLKNVYSKFEPSIIKALQKPQKAGQHFHNYFFSVNCLIEKFMPVEKCKNFTEKVHKFECTEIFHVSLLNTIFKKCEKNDKNLVNMLMSFIHLQMNLLKHKNQDDKEDKLNEIALIFSDFLTDIDAEFNVGDVCKNETFKTFCKLSLKYGVSGDYTLLNNLSRLLKIVLFDKNDARLCLDMLISHSEFLEVVLGKTENAKMAVLNLFSVLCRNWPQFMERQHVPILLASYTATLRKSDKIILNLLQMYEEHSDQTRFFDFKPFLWGQAAASYYSVRLDVQKALWRQPKMGDILDNLQDNFVHTTITNFPFTDALRSQNLTNTDEEIANITYDLTFLLPLFSQLLAHENVVQTYRFSRSGALSLTIIALSSEDKEFRLAACHVLARYYHHLEINQTGKDHLLWIRFVEALCKGVAVLDNFKLDNFAAIYLARMATILTQPGHVMYIPLSQYLAAKSTLTFNTIPELYTFLHSSDINFQDHRNFILQLLKDGLRTDKDFLIFIRSMAFKLISELCSSSICDIDTKLNILTIFVYCCKIPLGVKMLCRSHSFIAQVYNMFAVYSKMNDKREASLALEKLNEILYYIRRVK